MIGSSNTLAQLCHERGLQQRNRHLGPFRSLNSLVVHIDAQQGTVLHHAGDLDIPAFLARLQRDHDQWSSTPQVRDNVEHLVTSSGLAQSPVHLDLGDGLQLIYHPWRELGSDGQSIWLRACVMLPPMDARTTYPAAAARSMLCHSMVARASGLPMASITLHIPRLYLSGQFELLPPPAWFSVDASGKLSQLR